MSTINSVVALMPPTSGQEVGWRVVYRDQMHTLREGCIIEIHGHGSRTMVNLDSGATISAKRILSVWRLNRAGECVSA